MIILNTYLKLHGKKYAYKNNVIYEIHINKCVQLYRSTAIKRDNA